LQYIKELLHPAKIDWKQVIRNSVNASIRSTKKPSFKRLSRRYGEEVKGRVPTRIAKIIIALDTSGSVSRKDYKNFMSEIDNIHKNYPVELRIIYCDAQIANDKVYKKRDKIPMKFYGGGGTDFNPVFEYVKRKKYNPQLLIYFTDSYGDYPTKNPGYKTIWAYSSKGDKKRKAPFGLEVYVDDENDKDNDY
jgi:predicted metal-dependent peptidase